MRNQARPAATGHSVIVVEDDASMSQAMDRILRLGGYTPVTFSSAEALLDAGGSASACCLVLDVHLPGLTGFELHDRLLRLGALPPVIFITAYDEPETRGQAESAGCAAYFTKPFSGLDLVAAVGRAIKDRATGTTQ